ncbi:hypothetical protein LguiB_020980 [Lonicera macranthoides]
MGSPVGCTVCHVGEKIYVVSSRLQTPSTTAPLVPLMAYVDISKKTSGSPIGCINNPLCIQSFAEADDALKLHDIVHCSLDVVDERAFVADSLLTFACWTFGLLEFRFKFSRDLSLQRNYNHRVFGNFSSISLGGIRMAKDVGDIV